MYKILTSIFILSLVLIGCTDTLEKTAGLSDKPRIEYSDCTSCYECIDGFSCPEGAIKIDQRTQTAYIDADLCVGCMECMNLFSCPDDAFTLSVDDIAPAQITSLTATSDSIGKLQIQFTATGDDNTSGRAYRYEMTIRNSNDQIIVTDFEPTLPQNSGVTESWELEGLPENELVTISIQAFDELDLVSDPATAEVQIMGETIDEIPPSAIEDVAISSISMDSFQIGWTAPGDDGELGTAASYIIKVHTEEITEANWETLDEYPQNLVPAAAGEIETIVIVGLEPLTEYFAGVKAVDEVQNIADLSNIAQATTTDLPDVTAPAAITDLQAVPTDQFIELNWTATGDDGMEGTAHHYEIRIAEFVIDETNWEDADLLPGPPWPLVAGNSQSYTVEGLQLEVTYYFAIKVFDENENVSPLSNVPEAQLVIDTIPPEDITDLEVYEGVTTNLSTIKIMWTAPGDDGEVGTADHYEIKYSTSPINSSNWDSAITFADVPDPQAAGATQFCYVNVLDPAVIYYFAIKAYDENGNENQVSNSPAGKIVYQINTAACHNCSNCIYDCDDDAILQGPGYKYIDPDLCVACGDCSCPWNLIYKAVVAY